MITLGASLALVTAIGWVAARAGASPGESAATRAVRGAVIAFAALVVTLQALGVCGLLRPRLVLAALAVVAALAAAGVAARRALRPPPPLPVAPPRATEGGARRDRGDRMDRALAATVAGALGERLWAGLHRTSFLYDTLSYHLHMPVTWMHAERLQVVPTVFGDPAAAYAPAHLELWFWFLMAPLRSDYLAAAGQWPFAVLAVLAIAAAVRELGGSRAAALAAGLAFLLCPEVFSQASTAMVDLGMASFLVAAIVFAVRAVCAVLAPRASDVGALGVCLGLCAGTKAIGLVFAAPLALLAMALLARRRRVALLGLLGVTALAAGGFWHVRNAVLTGNPFYPLAVRAGSRVLLRGLYDAAAMRAWDYHLPITDAAALGTMLLDAGAGFALGSVIALGRRPWWALGCAALVGLFWLAVPYQESRFLFPAFAVAAVAMGSVQASWTSPDASPPALRVLPLGLAAGGALLSLPAPVVLVLALAAALGSLAPLPPRLPAAWLAAAALAMLAAASVGLERARARDPAYAVGDDLDPAWTWFRAHVRGARVAYTGVNLPFPLAGVELANDVRYVNVAGAPGDALHDFPPGPPAIGAEPAPYRDGARFETWATNLRAARVEVLFVAALYPIVRRTIAHDSDGFPVERAWADAHPDGFHLRFASPAARVYAVDAR